MTRIPEVDGRLADAVLFGLATALGGLAFGYLWHTHGEILDIADLISGTAACLALWWRRTRPVAVFVLAFGVAAFSPLALGAGLVAVCTAASRARGRTLAAVVVMAIGASLVWPLVNPSAGETVNIGFPGFLFTVIAFGWGLYLRERASRLEAAQERHAELAREAERRRIAREMHDVLAHRLSLLSLHAGALEFRPDAPAGEIAQAATVIRTAAVTALSELRQIVTVLREEPDGTGPPQPGIAELAELLEESRSAGMTLRAQIDVGDADELPATSGRTAYRVVQEGLTNARKHAPGAPVEVTVTGGTASLDVQVITFGAAGAPETPGGAGLIGLTERVALAGGELEHGPNGQGDFVLRMRIPVPQ